MAELSSYECQVCGYIYHPDRGDERGGIEPCVAFEELPDGWLCPWCDADRGSFEPYRYEVKPGRGDGRGA